MIFEPDTKKPEKFLTNFRQKLVFSKIYRIDEKLPNAFFVRLSYE